MIQDAANRLQYLCDTIPGLLRAIPAQTFTGKPAPGKWSRQEIIGHLADSALNNLQRFIRGQFEDRPFIVYDQDNWVAASRYQDMPSDHVISFWEAINRHIVELATKIPEEKLACLCKTNEPAPVTLEWLINDYVVHQEHHLRQVVDY